MCSRAHCTWDLSRASIPVFDFSQDIGICLIQKWGSQASRLKLPQQLTKLMASKETEHCLDAPHWEQHQKIGAHECRGNPPTARSPAKISEPVQQLLSHLCSRAWQPQFAHHLAPLWTPVKHHLLWPIAKGQWRSRDITSSLEPFHASWLCFLRSNFFKKKSLIYQKADLHLA